MTSSFTYIITTGSFIFNYFQFLKSSLIWRKVLNSSTSAVLWRLGRFLLQVTENSPLKQLLLFSLSVVSNSLQPHGLQNARLSCPSPSPRVCSNSCSLNWWCHPTTLSSVTPFFCPQSFPVSGSFAISQLFALVAKGLDLQLQHQSFQWIFMTDFL